MKRPLRALLLTIVLPWAAAADPSAEVLPWANALRESAAAAAPLAADAALDRLAAAHAAELAAAGVLSHESPVDGRRASDRNAQRGGTEVFIGEILGAGPDLADIEAAWEESPAHRAAVINPRYTRLGAGTATFGAQQVWVVVLARKLVDEVVVAAVGTSLFVTGTVCDGRASGPFLEDAATMTPVAPVTWDPATGRFFYRLAVAAAGGRWLLGVRSADTGTPEITNSVTWPPATASPAGAARSAAPSPRP